jgi:hypothetical protein
MDQPTDAGWIDVKRIFKYLRGTSKYGLLYRVGTLKGILEAFSDADFAGDVGTRQSTSGIVAVYAGGAFAWPSQLQRTVAFSTTEAEFIAASEGAKELLWLKRVLEELSVKGGGFHTLYVDNASALKVVSNPEFHKQSKHIEVWHYFVSKCYQDGRLKVEHIDGCNHLADLLMKRWYRIGFDTLHK